MDTNGNLVILETQSVSSLFSSDGSKSFADTYSDILSGRNITVRQVEFSYNELNDVFNFMRYFIPNNQDNRAASNIQRVVFDVRTNRIVVKLNDYCEEMEGLFRRTVLDSPILIIEQETMPIPSFFEREFADYDEALPSEGISDFELDEALLNSSNSITLSPGSRIHGRGFTNQSVGFRAFSLRYGKYGIVTCTHSDPNRLTPGTRMAVWQGTTIVEIGYVSTKSILHEIDASFVILENATINHFPTTARVALRNDIVRLHGFVSGNSLVGTVGAVELIVSMDANGLRYTVLATEVMYSQPSQDGDSGGLISCTSSITIVSGIHAGRNRNNPNIGYFICVHNILAELGLRL
jgi:hypothetical protein